MSFLIYLAVLVVAAASALFGLDLLTSPLPEKTVRQIAITRGATTPARPEADEQPATRARNSARPSMSVPLGRPMTAETTGTPAQDEKQPPASSERAAQSAAVAPAEAKADVSAVALPAAQAEAEQSANRCNVDACTAAYQSFRASDCTYQPYSGPRRVCTKSPATAQQQSVDGTSQRLDRATQRARRSTVEDLDDDDVLAPSRRVIIIERGFGDYGYDRWR